jgi:hypothetical protein
VARDRKSRSIVYHICIFENKGVYSKLLPRANVSLLILFSRTLEILCTSYIYIEVRKALPVSCRTGNRYFNIDTSVFEISLHLLYFV